MGDVADIMTLARGRISERVRAQRKIVQSNTVFLIDISF